MFLSKEMLSVSSMFSAYTTMTAYALFFRTVANNLIPHPIQCYLLNAFNYYLKTPSPILTLIIEESNGISKNQVYDAAETYLSARIGPEIRRLKISQIPKEKSFKIRLDKGAQLVDHYNGVEVKWVFTSTSESSSNNGDGNSDRSNVKRELFELSFHEKHRDMVVNSYIPSILSKAKAMTEEERVLKMHTLNGYGSDRWNSINLEHPSTFETLAMEPELKRAVMEDLNRFVRRSEYYKRVGRAWKRGYLLYGPPGTGKSSLVAAMANYLKFDIYDLQLENIVRDSDLRRLLLSTANRSILVIEDIDCSVDLPERRQQGLGRQYEQLTLSGLLNFIDGLWSSVGDERIIVFTTNHKERLDPALLRPGRMDMHIHMSYCSYHGFQLLASNYLGVSNKQHEDLFTEIEGLIDDTNITPAQVAEELMKIEDAKEALEDFVGLLKRKKMEGDVCENDGPEKGSSPEPRKRRKVDTFKQRKPVGGQKRRNSLRRTRGRSL